MISREKLEELVSKDKKVYWHRVDNNSYYIIRFDTFKFLPEGLEVWDRFEGLLFFNYNNLITKEEYEWGCEFQNIKRTETLSLPSWEEINERLKNETHIAIDFYDKQHNKHFIWLNETQITIVDFINGNPHIGTDEILTKENYIEACEIARKLFLGEDLGNENKGD